MAKRKKKDDIGLQVGADVANINEDSGPTAADEVTRPMQAPPAEDKGPSLPSTITILPNQHAISVVGHHMNDGRPDRATIIKAMEMLITGFIHFPGAYHDNRKRELYQHLANHYKTFNMEPPVLR